MSSRTLSERIKFSAYDDELVYSYVEIVPVGTSGAHRMYEAVGIVPDDIIALGQGVVKAFATQQILEKIEKKKEEHSQMDAFLGDPNYALTTSVEGIVLEGRIVSAENRTLTVLLENPVKGTGHVQFGFASALAGKHILEGGTFTLEAINVAKMLMTEIYRKKRDIDPALGSLVDDLNK